MTSLPVPPASPTGPGRASVRQRAHLKVTLDEGNDGPDFDPADVTPLVGVAPSRAHRRGDPWRGSLRRRFSGWYIEVPSRKEYDTDAVVRELLDEVEPYAEGLACAREALRLQAGVQVVIEMHHRSTPPGWAVVDA